MPSTDTLERLHRICSQRRSLTGWSQGLLKKYRTAIPLLWRGVKLRLTGWSQGLLKKYRTAIPLLRRGVKLRLTRWSQGLLKKYRTAIPLHRRGIVRPTVLHKSTPFVARCNKQRF